MEPCIKATIGRYIVNKIKVIKEFRCYEAKIEESEKRPAATGSQTQDT